MTGQVKGSLVKGSFAALLVAGVVSFSACGSDDGDASAERVSEGTAVTSAYSRCFPVRSIAAEKSGETVQIVFDVGEARHMESYQCMLDELGAPQSVALKVSQTSPMMGAQESAWDGVAMTWSYENDPVPMLTTVFESTP